LGCEIVVLLHHVMYLNDGVWWFSEEGINVDYLLWECLNIRLNN